MAQPADWHVEDIKAAIRKTGATTVSLSLQHGYSRAAVRVAFLKPWPAIEAIIAAHLGVPPQSIWPSRYDPAGEPIRKRPSRPKKERNAPALTPHRISRSAA